MTKDVTGDMKRRTSNTADREALRRAFDRTKDIADARAAEIPRFDQRRIVTHLRKKVAALSSVKTDGWSQGALEALLRTRKSFSRARPEYVGRVIGSTTGLSAKEGDVLGIADCKAACCVIMLADCEPGAAMRCVRVDTGREEDDTLALVSWVLLD
jgi:hypothetical protein